MDHAAPESLTQSMAIWWTIVAIAFASLVATNLPWQLDDYDQAKQAFTSFEMVKQGHWLYQHTPRGRVATKPPLVGWVSAGLFEVTRSWDLAWRLPVLLSAAVLAVSLYGVAKRAYGTTAAAVAAGAFVFNLLAPRLATLVRTDMPLALVISLIGLVIWEKIRANEPWQRRDRVRVFLLLCAAMLIKGPIVYAFLLPGMIFFEWWRRRRGHAVSTWSGWWPWALSLGLFLAWAAGGIRFVPGFYDQVVVREFLGRFGETIHRPQPFWFYLPHLLHKFAPWSLLLVVFAIVLRRSSTPEGRRLSPETMWLLCWSVGGLVLMSFIPSKRVDRIFPVIPPLCLLLAAQVARWPNDQSRRFSKRTVGAVALVVAILFSGSYSIFKIVTGYRGHRDALVEFGKAVRQDAMANGRKFEALAGSDEGMILYLDKNEFIEADQAVALWKSNQIDALVVPVSDFPSLQGELPGAVEALRSVRRVDLDPQYMLLTRQTR